MQALTSMLRYWIPFILYSAIILFFSTRPLSHLPRLPLSDKIIHFLEYSLYGALLARLLLQRFPRTWIRPSLLAWFGVALFAVLDETVQNFVAGRQADVWDWMADVTGGLFGITCYLMIRHIYMRMRTQE